MALAFTENIELGYLAPDFILPEPLTAKNRNLNELKGKVATVVMFICNHCPYVKHINNALVELSNEYLTKGISFIAINSNDVENYPDDSPEKMVELAIKQKYQFPYLFDQTQEVAKAYHAVCTPDFSIFNNELKCVYRGQFDESRPGNNLLVTGNDIKQALDALLAGAPIPTKQIPSAGCSIKWKI